MRTLLNHRMDDTYDAISRVMAIVPTVVDYHKPEEDADPWVLAKALQIQDCGHEACIVTEDVIDRDSMSIATAADTLHLKHCRLCTFLRLLPQITCTLSSLDRERLQSQLGM